MTKKSGGHVYLIDLLSGLKDNEQWALHQGEILRVLKSLYPPFKERLGVFTIELESSKTKPQK